MRNEPERQAIHHALEEATSGLRENPFLYERVKARITEGEPVVKKKISLGLILALALMAITLTGLAAGLIFGQEWHLTIRNGLMDADPEKYTAVKEHLVAPYEQTDTENSLVCMTVQDVALVADKNVVTVSVHATLKDPAQYELYPMWDLDADGAYVGGDMPEIPDEDGENRAVHWLWRHDADSSDGVRFGLPADMMDDSNKTLLLIDMIDTDSKRKEMKLWNSCDALRLSDSSCLFFLEYTLDQANVSAGSVDEMHALTYQVPYRVVAFTDTTPDEELYLGGETGMVTFAVNNK